MHIVSALDFASAARKIIHPHTWDFIEGGSGFETTLTANRHLFDSTQIRPRVLIDVSICDTVVTVFESPLPAPIAVAPIAYHQLISQEGEVATARALSGSLMVVSFFASRTIEDIAAAATGPLWMQLYWLRRRAALAAVVKRAQAAGCQALVLTVDTPQIGRRWRDMRNGFGVPAHIRAANLDPELMTSTRQSNGIAVHAAQSFDQTITWADLAWLKGLTDLPLVLKGLLTAEDAALAVEHGADAIIVSNHGGRQLDGAVPSLRALPEVIAAVDGRCPVLLDGGVRTGRDIFVALALGAAAVLVGRPVMWALAAEGEHGVSRLLTILTEELQNIMTLAGRPTVTGINRSALS